ncbi:MAG: ATP-dependent DNA helicase [Gammaproteobacteria bacterium]|nr:ATP-dependent DNA helicase [Gammaproteobacteria bacterium]
MAAAVEAALEADRRLVIEAGTGTGKTFAYLVPALLSGRRVLVATGTKNLQDQLFHRDLPGLRAALRCAARVALLKGRGNYLCHYRLTAARQEPRGRQFARQLAAIDAWSRRSADGDLDALGSLPPAVTAAVTSTADNCLGGQCPEFDRCCVVRARRAAQAADLVVANHHLLFSDFRLREEGFGMLPGIQAVVVDEAHQLPELAPQFFGERLSTRMLAEYVADLRAQCDARGDMAALEQTLAGLADAVAALEQAISLWAGERAGEARERWERLPETLTLAAPALVEALTPVSTALEGVAERSPELQALAARAALFTARISRFAGAATPGWVRWIETLARGGALYAAPVDAREGFARMFESYRGAWVFTSATLAVGDDFHHFTGALGLQAPSCVRLDSPFDFRRQARLWLPQALPEPNDAGYFDAVAEALRPVLAASRGGAFVLCTSHRGLRHLARRLDDLGLPLLVQGDSGKTELLAQFARAGNAVLIATASFWEGVDVRGPALRVVAIDRLPFAAPGDPLLDARLTAIREAGGNPFNDQQFPQMLTALRQGVGRLIRDAGDRGLVVLCDPRLSSRGYGARILAALPPMPRLPDLDAVRAWLAEITESRQSGVRAA